LPTQNKILQWSNRVVYYIVLACSMIMVYGPVQDFAY
jgi:hypothetical protein